MSEVFNLDRKVNMQENIDPQGKKWEIKKVNKSGALFTAVPNPYRADFICPPSFSGSWTQPSVLQEKITIWLNGQWDKAEKAQQRAGIVATQEKLAAKVAETKQTPEESMAGLDPEIAAALEDVINVNEQGTSVPDDSNESNSSNEAAQEGQASGNSDTEVTTQNKASNKVTKKKVAKKGK